jgi:hypothetical protein
MTVDFAVGVMKKLLGSEDVESSILEDLHSECLKDRKFKKKVFAGVGAGTSSSDQRFFFYLIRRQIKINERRTLV